MAAVHFARLQKGSAAVSLHDVKLVDSRLNAAASQIVAASISIKEGSVPAPAALKDIGGHWAKDAIEQAVQQGWVTGYANGTFQPGKEVTRIEWAAMLIRALGADDAARLPVQFKDAKNIPAWGLPFVEEAVVRGIMNGYDDGSFGLSEEDDAGGNGGYGRPFAAFGRSAGGRRQSCFCRRRANPRLGQALRRDGGTAGHHERAERRLICAERPCDPRRGGGRHFGIAAAEIMLLKISIAWKKFFIERSLR